MDRFSPDILQNAEKSISRPETAQRGIQTPAGASKRVGGPVQGVCKAFAGLPQPGTSAWNHLAPRVKQQAHLLRKALAGALDMQIKAKWGRAGIEAAGLRDYRAIFGHDITPRHFWRLMDLVLERDGGRRDFDNLALYLSGRLARKKNALPFEQAARELGNLRSAVQGLLDLAHPSPAEMLLLWDSAFSDYQVLVDAGMSDRKARRRVIAALDASGVPLAASRSALARSFCRKLDRWIEGGRVPSAIQDLRTIVVRNELPLTDEDKKILMAHAVNGGLSKAWRDCMRKGLLSPAVTQFYVNNPAGKSYVPNRVREELGPQIAMMYDIHHGPRQAALKGAYITRDWSGVSPADWLSGDDTTLPLYFWEEGEDGRPRILRGQSLFMSDCRTDYILGFALHSERNYTAKVIRGLILKVHDTYGLPREGFYFENGTWRSAKLLKGATDEVPSEETELGLREWVKFRHAKPGNARAKTVERVIGLLQTLMEDQPGYCGRNEQIERFERLQREMLDASAERRHPREFLLHRDEWVERLQTICDAFNSEVQQGGRLKDLSPREAWEQWFDHSRPLHRLEGAARYLLANHRRPMKVTRNGICVQIGGDRHWFRNEATGGLIGQIVQVYFNPEDLSSIYVRRSVNDSEAIVVPAEIRIPAMSATPDELRAAQASVDSHNRPARTLYAAIKPHMPDNSPSKFRRTIVDQEFVESHQAIAEQQEAIRADQDERRQTRRNINRMQRNLGITVNPAVNESRVQEGLKMLQRAKEHAEHPSA